jgi:hypothetical protein
VFHAEHLTPRVFDIEGQVVHRTETSKVNTVLILPPEPLQTAGYIVQREDATMAASEKEEILCPICYLSVELGVDSHRDEGGRTVHEACYVKKIVPAVKRAVPRFSGESRFDCFA